MDARGLGIELHGLVPNAARGEGEPEHEQQVADDRTDERGLHDGELAGGDQEDADDELGQVAHRRVEQAAALRPEPHGQLLGRLTDQPGQRHDGQRRCDEREHLHAGDVRADRDRHEDEKPAQRGRRKAGHQAAYLRRLGFLCTSFLGHTPPLEIRSEVLPRTAVSAAVPGVATVLTGPAKGISYSPLLAANLTDRTRS